jgi:hypothetical protein
MRAGSLRGRRNTTTKWDGRQCGGARSRFPHRRAPFVLRWSSAIRSATAAFLGQTAAAAIIQTNVMTVAEAAAVAAPGTGAAGGAGGSVAGGGAGGGMSATTIGIVGAAAGGGTLVAVDATKTNDSSGVTIYGGPFWGVMTESLDGVCVTTDQISGTLSLGFSVASDGSVQGTAAQDSGSHQWVSTGASPAIGQSSQPDRGFCVPNARRARRIGLVCARFTANVADRTANATHLTISATSAENPTADRYRYRDGSPSRTPANGERLRTTHAA